jgi:hypothetical protein
MSLADTRSNLASSTSRLALTGHDVVILRRKPAAIRAEAAARLVNGAWSLSNASPALAAEIFRTHPRVVHRALGHPPRQRPSDAVVDRTVREFGLDRVMASLDRLTRPMAQAAE